MSEISRLAASKYCCAVSLYGRVGRHMPPNMKPFGPDHGSMRSHAGEGSSNNGRLIASEVISFDHMRQEYHTFPACQTGRMERCSRLRSAAERNSERGCGNCHGCLAQLFVVAE